MAGQLTEICDQIYFIQSSENKRIKIGVSRSPLKRLKMLQTGCSEKLEMLFYVDGTRENEKAYHRKFNHLKRIGEWFDPGADLLKCLTELWRNRQKGRSKWFNIKPAHFYRFLCHQNYTWSDKALVNAIFYRYYTSETEKNGYQRMAIAAYDNFPENKRPTKNQQVTVPKSDLKSNSCA